MSPFLRIEPDQQFHLISTTNVVKGQILQLYQLLHRFAHTVLDRSKAANLMMGHQLQEELLSMTCCKEARQKQKIFPAEFLKP